jgi:hypothetical protein
LAFQALEEGKKKKDTHKDRLKDQASADGEGFFSTVVAFFVEAVDRFKPSWRFGEKIADSCQVVGQN